MTAMSEDNELELMKWMSVDQLDRYADLIQQMEDAEVSMEEIKKQMKGRESEPLLKVIGEPKFQKFLFQQGRWHGAMDDKLNILKSVSGRFPAWARLLQMACSEIEAMVDDGKSPTSCGGKDKFWSAVHLRILQVYGTEIKKDRKFKHVRILEFLKQVLPTRLEECAAGARAAGNPILAQVLEELAESREAR